MEDKDKFYDKIEKQVNWWQRLQWRMALRMIGIEKIKAPRGYVPLDKEFVN